MVDAKQVMEEDVEVSVEAIGSLEAGEEVMISAEVAALVKEIHFQEGASVNKGATLFLLDDDLARLQRDQTQRKLERMTASLERMEAELRRNKALEENAQSNFSRKESLLEQGATTQAVFLDAKAAYAAAQAATDQARAALEETQRSIRDKLFVE